MPSRLYQGTLVHELVHRMRTGRRRLKLFLNSSPASKKQYLHLLANMLQFCSSSGDKRIAPPLRQAPPPKQAPPEDDLTADLEQLFLQYENEEEVETALRSSQRVEVELTSLDLVKVKTRYTTKGRSDRSLNPELTCKKECRSWDLL